MFPVFQQAHSARVTGAAFFESASDSEPDLVRPALATAGEDGYVVFWHRNGREMRRLSDHRELSCIAVSPDGKFVAVGTALTGKNHIFVYGVREQDEWAKGRATAIREGLGRIESISFSPDSQTIYYTTSLSLFYSYSRNGEYRRLNQKMSPMRLCSVAANDGLVATVGDRPEFYLWPKGGKPLTVELKQGEGAPEKSAANSLSWTGDGATLVIGTGGGWFTYSRANSRASFTSSPVGSLDEVRPGGDGSWLAAVQKGGRSVVICGRGGEVLQKLEPKDLGAVSSVSFNRTGQDLVITGDLGTSTWARDSSSGRFARVQTLVNEVAGVENARISPNGSTLAVGLVSGGVELWDLARGAALGSIGSRVGVVGFSYSPDGKQLLQADASGGAALYDSQTGALLGALPRGPASARVRLRAPILHRSPDGTLFASALSTSTAEVKSPRLWKLVSPFTPIPLDPSPGTCINHAFSEDQLITLSEDLVLRSYDCATGKLVGSAVQLQVPEELTKAKDDYAMPAPRVRSAVEEIEGAVHYRGFVLSPDGRQVAVIAGGRCGVWDRTTGRFVYSFLAAAGADIVEVCFSSLDDRVYGVTSRGALVTWRPDVRRQDLKDPASKEVIYPSRSLGGAGARVSAARYKDATGQTKHGIVTVDASGGIKFFKESDSGAPELIGTMAVLRRGGWGFTDADGRYDAASGGRVEGLHWSVDQEPFGLADMMRGYYDPGLVAKCLGSATEAKIDVPTLAQGLPPLVEDLQLEGNEVRFKLVVRSGKVGDVSLKVNNSEALRLPYEGGLSEEDLQTLRTEGRLSKPIVVKDLTARLHSAQESSEQLLDTLRVDAYNRDNTARSSGELLVPRPKITRDRRLFAIIVGANIGDLTLSTSDARAIHRVLSHTSGEYKNLKLHLLLNPSDASSLRASKAEFEEAIRKIKGESPTADDRLLIYFSGHGNVDPFGKGYFYVIQDEGPGVFSNEIAELGRLPMSEKFVILDTCKSGSVQKELNTVQQSLEEVNERFNFGFLSGSSEEGRSYARAELGNSLLTFKLLQSLAEFPSDASGTEESTTLARAASAAFHSLQDFARALHLRQEPRLSLPPSSRGGEFFPIGTIPAEDRFGLLSADFPTVLPCKVVSPEGKRQRSLENELHRLLREGSYEQVWTTAEGPSGPRQRYLYHVPTTSSEVWGNGYSFKVELKSAEPLSASVVVSVTSVADGKPKPVQIGETVTLSGQNHQELAASIFKAALQAIELDFQKRRRTQAG